jgi:uncharacterized membrane protein (UPF0182 family)
MREIRFLIPFLILAALLALSALLSLLGDWYWFSSVGYGSVFLTILMTRIGVGVLVFIVFFIVSSINIRYAARKAARAFGTEETGSFGIGILAVIGSAAAAIGISGSWETILLFFNQTSFSISDPLFGQDIGFYFFSLPFYTLLVHVLLALIVFTIALSAASFLFTSFGLALFTSQRLVWRQGGIDWGKNLRVFLPQLNLLLSFLFAALAARLWLARYSLLYSTTGTVVGAGYTDVHVLLPVLTLLTALALVIGIGFLVNEKFQRKEVITYGIGAFAVIVLIGLIATAAVQALIVQPDEFNLEREYLANNIQFTLAAYDLDGAREDIFPVHYTLTADDIRENAATVENIRLWDWRPLKSTYEQLQLFRTYYQFNDVDVDRYRIGSQYKEVLVSARELNLRSLPPQAQTWVNQHLVYTHGYGAVMNPVDQVTEEGLPVFFLQDIPPVASGITLTEPRIYYGELTDTYVIIETETEEFDYPSGEQNVYGIYQGQGGVPLTDRLSNLVYALRFGSVELLVSGSLTEESRILLHRTIQDRVRTIAPFLQYDSDPYMVIEDGRIYWIQDAYTVSRQYPYSEPVYAYQANGEWLNYIRNSVKVVIDAYHGDVRFYVVDTSDPLITTYRKIFPELFFEFSEMPASLQPHLRYPQGLFEVQAHLYGTYHMKDPRVFYNREDVWVTPDEIYAASRQPMVPYYVIMQLPGETSEEFILMLPFTPRNKENMIGWMAARCDAPNYGQLVVYQFSKQELTYGPMQVEARIDQDTQISQQITLWSQAGSEVVRGNTLVIPIEDSILYVEPLYLEATERGTLPQLQRVIVAYGDRLTMQKTLSEALAVIFGDGAEPPPGDGIPPPTGDLAQRLARIAELYGLAQQALADGDLGLYQRYVDEIGGVAASSSF